jgi:ribosomal-protein-alanine N-acetyltransferase
LGYEQKKLTPEHVPQVCAIARQCFPESWSEDDYRYFLTHECAYSFGLFSPENVLGAYLLSLRVLGEIDIISIATAPIYRRMGLGAYLLSRAIEDLQTKRLMLEVDTENTAAIALYLKAGFKIQGVRKKYYDAKRDAYFMTFEKDLSPTQVVQ